MTGVPTALGGGNRKGMCMIDELFQGLPTTYEVQGMFFDGVEYEAPLVTVHKREVSLERL